MLSDAVGRMLRDAREAQGLTRQAVAEKAGVSLRLLSEVERGERPNVALETVLKLLDQVGVQVRLAGPLGQVAEIRTRQSDALARAARAAHRRATWSATRTSLISQSSAKPAASATERLHTVAQVSASVHALQKVGKTNNRG